MSDPVEIVPAEYRAGAHDGAGRTVPDEMVDPASFSSADLYIEQIDLGGGAIRLCMPNRPAVPCQPPGPASGSRQREAARLITMAWGDRYIDDLLAFTIPALLSPGNLPAFVEHFDLEFVLVTETRLFDFLTEAKVIARLLRFCDIRLVPIDDLISPWYGITLTYALVRGFADLGEDMVGAHLLFTNTDFIPADGSYRKLAQMILRGERLVVSPSYCMVFEDTVDLLRARHDADACTLSMSHREMAAMILENRHNTVRAKTVNQQLFRLHWHDQFYWYVDENTLLCRQLPIAVLYMQPERVILELPTFWDYGMLSEICPTTTPCVLGDSDDFLMAELRARDSLRSLYQLGWPSVDELAAELSKYLTKDHHDYGRHTLVLHAGDLPPSLAEESEKLAAFMKEIYDRLSPPVSYRHHPFWEEGYDRFCVMRNAGATALRRRESSLAELQHDPVYVGRHNQIALLRNQIFATEDQMKAVDRRLSEVRRQFAGRLAELTAVYERERERLTAELDVSTRSEEQEIQRFRGLLLEKRHELAELKQRQHQVLENAMDPSAAGNARSATASDSTNPGLEPLPASKVPSTSIRAKRRLLSALAGAYRSIFGQLPNTTGWHPYHTSLRYVRAALDSAVADGARNLLFVASDDLLASALVRNLPMQRITVAPAIAKRGLEDHRGDDTQCFDLCLCLLSFDDLMDFREMMTRLRPRMLDRSKFIVFHHNHDERPLDASTYDFTLKLFPFVGKSRISLTGSRAAELAIRWFRWTVATRSASRLSGLFALATSLAICAPLARFATWKEARHNPRTYPKHCTSMTIEIELG